MSNPETNSADVKPLQKHVLFCFSLYGFLKNQRYFEPFIVLAFAEKGLSFFAIGLLMGFRELCINLFEIPSGAIADLYGRRRSMIFSFAAYTLSFIFFAVSDRIWELFGAMFLFAIGEAFRTGTHKAIIFDYLKSRGQADARTRVYGFTRSWAQIGSSLSAVIAACLVFWQGNYSVIFWICAIPSGMNIINFMFYPPDVEGRPAKVGVGDVIRHTLASLREAWANRRQRRLLFESSGFDGLFKIAKDYLQLVIRSAALGLPILAAFDDKQRASLLIGFVYSAIFLVSSVASRQAHVVSDWRGGEDKAARSLWIATLVLYALLIPFLWGGLPGIGIGLFFLIYLMQNIWRPIQIGRLNACSDPGQVATTLSIESQLNSFVAMIIAPLLGLAVDSFGPASVGVVGVAICSLFLLARTKNATVDVPAP